MARVEVDKTWLVRSVGGGLDSAIDRAVHEHGMTATRSDQRLEMRGGSQVKMRLLGGNFTKDAVLPRWGLLERIQDPERSDVERITLHLEDRIGLGLMDPGMRKKCDRILGSIAFSIEAAIRENAAEMRDPNDQTGDWAPTETGDGDSPRQDAGSVAGELERLAQLHERGLLSSEEFAAAKAKLLS